MFIKQTQILIPTPIAAVEASVEMLQSLLCLITFKNPFTCIHRAHIKTYTLTEKKTFFLCIYTTMLHSLCIVKPRGFIFIHNSTIKPMSSSVENVSLLLFHSLPSTLSLVLRIVSFSYSFRFLIIAYKFIFFLHCASHSYSPPIPRFYL